MLSIPSFINSVTIKEALSRVGEEVFNKSHILLVLSISQHYLSNVRIYSNVPAMDCQFGSSRLIKCHNIRCQTLNLPYSSIRTIHYDFVFRPNR